jgi:uncharacterized membrane protein
MQETNSAPNNNEPSLGKLFSDLTEKTSLLMRQEVALAKKELGETVSQALSDVISLAVGAALAYIGLLALVAAAILGLALVLPAWASALIVGAIIVLIGGVLLLRGLNNLKKLDLMPRRTVDTLKEDVQAVKESVR